MIGAAAMAAHGVARSTADIDLLVIDRTCLDVRFWEALGRAVADVVVRAGDADDPLAGVVRLRTGSETTLDLVVGRSAWQAGVLERARESRIGGIQVPVATAADLVLLKLYAGGPQDAWDITQLVTTAPAVVADVDAAVNRLPREAQELWERLRGTRRRPEESP